MTSKSSPSSECCPQSTCCGLTRADWLLIVLGAAVLIANLFAARPLMSANDRSRWATVWSLVERGTYQIDEIDAQPAWTTIDKVRHEGHLYSSKPPLLSTMAAGIYWVLKQVGGYDLLRHTEETTHLVLLFMSGIPTVISFIVFARVLKRFTDDSTVQLIALGTLCFGTLVTGYATTFNNHSLGAVCLVFMLGPLSRLMECRLSVGHVFNVPGSIEGGHVENVPHNKLDFVLAGFWAAATVCCELPAAALGALAFLFALRSSSKRAFVCFAPAALIPFAAYFLTNAIATGGWKPFYSFYGTDKYNFVLNGVPSYWMNPRGLDRNLDGPFMYFVHCTIGHHGIFSLSPIFLLSLVSWCRRDWWRSTSTRCLMWLSLGLTVGVLGFYLSRTQNYNYGGNTFGLRWIIWLSPLWIVAMLPALQIAVKSKRGLAATLVLLLVSGYSAQASARNPWGESWLFHRLTIAGWIDYTDPPPELPYDRPLQTWFPELPGKGHEGHWIEFESPSSSVLGSHSVDVLRVTDLGSDAIGATSVRRVQFHWNAGHSGRERVLTVSLNDAAFDAGKPVAKQLAAFEATPTMTKPEVITFLRGLPYDRAYHGGNVRYLKTPLQSDLLQCHRAATQVTRKLQQGGTITDRCEVWLTPAVPFGVVQFELTQYNDRGEEVGKRRFVARKMTAR